MIGKDFKESYGNRFYKFTLSDQIVIGFNKTKRPFMFTDIERLLYHMPFGSNIAIIEIPDDAKVITDLSGFKTDKMIVTEFLQKEEEIIELYKRSREKGCQWTNYSSVFLAMGGHLKLLIWAINDGCPWNELTCAFAAKTGKLEVIKWLYINGCPYDKRTLQFASEHGQTHVLYWMENNML